MSYTESYLRFFLQDFRNLPTVPFPSKHFGYLHTDKFLGQSPLSTGLSYNINKGSFRAGVLLNRGRGLARAMLAMSGKGGML